MRKHGKERQKDIPITLSEMIINLFMSDSDTQTYKLWKIRQFTSTQLNSLISSLKFNFCSNYHQVYTHIPRFQKHFLKAILYVREYFNYFKIFHINKVSVLPTDLFHRKYIWK